MNSYHSSGYSKPPPISFCSYNPVLVDFLPLCRSLGGTIDPPSTFAAKDEREREASKGENVSSTRWARGTRSMDRHSFRYRFFFGWPAFPSLPSKRGGCGEWTVQIPDSPPPGSLFGTSLLYHFCLPFRTSYGVNITQYGYCIVR